MSSSRPGADAGSKSPAPTHPPRVFSHLPAHDVIDRLTTELGSSEDRVATLLNDLNRRLLRPGDGFYIAEFTRRARRKRRPDYVGLKSLIATRTPLHPGAGP
jgi:hypothetical protein